jgi:hypothetical protein
VLGGGGLVAAYGAELCGCGEGAEAAGYFCRSVIMQMSRSERCCRWVIRLMEH